MERSAGAIAAERASIAAQWDFPHRAPQATTRLEARDSWMVRCPSCRSYRRCLKNARLLKLRLTDLPSGSHSRDVTVLFLVDHQLLVLALDDVLDAHGAAVGRVASDQPLVAHGGGEGSHCVDRAVERGLTQRLERLLLDELHRLQVAVVHLLDRLLCAFHGARSGQLVSGGDLHLPAFLAGEVRDRALVDLVLLRDSVIASRLAHAQVVGVGFGRDLALHDALRSDESSSKVFSVPSRIAFFPVVFCHRSTITSEYGASSSIRYALRPVCSQPIRVEPLPPKRSRTFSPLREE